MLSILKSGEDVPTPGNLNLDIADTSLVEKPGLTRSEIVAGFRNARSLDVPIYRRFLGFGNFILCVHRKYFEIGKGMFSVETAALKIHIKLGA
jgi:hypothetical protein